MKAIVHIGTAKTGTTAIQSFLQSNRSALLARGILIPKSLGHAGHRKLAVMARENPGRDNFFKRIGIQDVGEQQEAIRNWMAAWDLEIASTPAKTCLISSEHLHSNLQSTAEVEYLRKLLFERFESVRIVIYIRDQLDLALSLRSTALKSGRRKFDIASPNLFSNYDYRETMRRWGEVFGHDAITLRLYERREFLEEDLITDFAQSCGIEVQGLHRPTKANPRLDELGLRLLSDFNRKLKPLGLNNEAEQRAKFTQFLEQHFTTGPDMGPGDQTIRDFEAYFSESNEWVRDQYFPHRARLFDILAYPPPLMTQDGTDVDRLISALVGMWIEAAPESKIE